jgi:hypothetical protein
MFVGKDISLQRLEHLKGSFTQEGSDLTRNKHYTRLESPARDKHFSLLQTFVNYRRKNLYDIVLWFLSYQTLFPFISKRISCSVCLWKHWTILERLAREYTLAYYEYSFITVVKSFMTLTPENESSHPNVNDVLHQNIDLRKNLSKF